MNRDYRLLQRHKINGVWQEPGFVQSFIEQHGDWLVSQGQAERVDGVPVARAITAPRVIVAPQEPPPRRWKCCGWT